MIFGVSTVSWGVPTDPLEEVKKFLKHIDKDMKTRLSLTQLEKVLSWHKKRLLRGKSIVGF